LREVLAVKGKLMKKISKVAALSISGALIVGAVASPALAHGKSDRYDKKWSNGLSIGDSASDGKKGKGKYRHADSTPADTALRTAILAANDTYQVAVDAAKATYATDTVQAKADRDAAHAAAVDQLDFIIANLEYRAATAVAREARNVANDAAYGIWLASVESALATYDAATTTGDVLNARITYRAAMSAASATYRTAMAIIKTDHIAAVESAQTDLIAALDIAVDQTQIDAAWATYDSAMSAAEAAEEAAKTTAKTAYKSATEAARTAYTTATGLSVGTTPQLAKLLKIR
jgi:hypothetical protein